MPDRQILIDRVAVSFGSSPPLLFAVPRRVGFSVAVFDMQAGKVGFEQGADFFSDVHAAVLAAGATDTNGEVGAVAALDEGG